MDAINKLISTTLQSKPLTHFRLKNLSAIAQTSEDHISRLGMGLSMASGRVDADWLPTPINSEIEIGRWIGKQLRGRTLFKDDLTLWMALALRHQTPSDYEEWRLILRSHWERGVEMLAKVSAEEDDWLLVVKSCLPN